MMLSYGPYLIAFFAALVAIRGDTWNDEKNRPSPMGWIAIAIAVLALIAGALQRASDINENDIDREIALKRFVDIALTMQANDLTFFDLNVDAEINLAGRFHIVDHPCAQLSQLMTSDATVLSDQGRQIATQMNEQCDLLRLEKTEAGLDYLQDAPGELVNDICSAYADVQKCHYVKSNPLVKIMNEAEQ